MDLKTQKNLFRENGYLVLEKFLNLEELQLLQQKIDGVQDGNIIPDISPGIPEFQIQWEPRVQHLKNLSRREKIRVIFHLCHQHSYFRQLAVHPRLTEVVRNLLGNDIKLYTDQMFVKPALYGSEVPWHHRVRAL